MAALISDNLKSAFTSLFIANHGVPDTIDINAELQKIYMHLQKREFDIILNGITIIAHALMDVKDSK